MRFLKHLYVQVLIGIALGAGLGVMYPDFAVDMKFFGDSFIALLKMLIGPIIFMTVVTGIANSGSMKKVGRIGVKSLLYFEVVSTFALVLGLVAVNLIQPGKGFNVDPSTLDASAVNEFSQKSHDLSTLGFIKSLIPSTFFNAFTASGDLLQILVLALLFGYALIHIGERGRPVLDLISSVSQVFFKMVHVLMHVAPIGAFGAMAFTVGKFGIEAFRPLFALMATVYVTCLIFIFVVLGAIAWFSGFSIVRFIRYIREELLTVLGTSSSESVLVPMMERLENLGCSRPVVGLVIPTGYSFNLDGTNIYLTIAAVFVAQALNVDLTLGDQLALLLVATLTSKGASGVTGAGFITLAATLAVVPKVPVAGLALILGVDRFMSEARALTNLIGNGVATVVISKWENELNVPQMERELNPPSV